MEFRKIMIHTGPVRRHDIEAGLLGQVVRTVFEKPADLRTGIILIQSLVGILNGYGDVACGGGQKYAQENGYSNDGGVHPADVDSFDRLFRLGAVFLPGLGRV